MWKIDGAKSGREKSTAPPACLVVKSGEHILKALTLARTWKQEVDEKRPKKGYCERSPPWWPGLATGSPVIWYFLQKSPGNRSALGGAQMDWWGFQNGGGGGYWSFRLSQYHTPTHAHEKKIKEGEKETGKSWRFFSCVKDKWILKQEKCEDMVIKKIAPVRFCGQKCLLWIFLVLSWIIHALARTHGAPHLRNHIWPCYSFRPGRAEG